MNCYLKYMNRFSQTMIVVVAVMSAGCTYSFKGGSAPANLKTIVIPVVNDQSGFGDPTLQDSFTQKIVKEFTNDNSLQVTDRNSADSMLEVVITDVKDVPLALQGGENVSTRRITVTVRATFQDLKQRKKLWEKSFSQYGDYPSGGGLTQRTVGVTEAVSKLIEDILNETVAGW
jgi:TolB-like protein